MLVAWPENERFFCRYRQGNGTLVKVQIKEIKLEQGKRTTEVKKKRKRWKRRERKCDRGKARGRKESKYSLVVAGLEGLCVFFKADFIG